MNDFLLFSAEIFMSGILRSLRLTKIIQRQRTHIEQQYKALIIRKVDELLFELIEVNVRSCRAFFQTH